MQTTIDLAQVKIKALRLERYTSKYIGLEYLKSKSKYQPKLDPIKEEQETKNSPIFVAKCK